jgi:hypothetical protein
MFLCFLKTTLWTPSKVNKPKGASPLTECCFFHSLLWVRRILGGDGVGGLKNGGMLHGYGITEV